MTSLLKQLIISLLTQLMVVREKKLNWALLYFKLNHLAINSSWILYRYITISDVVPYSFQGTGTEMKRKEKK